MKTQFTVFILLFFVLIEHFLEFAGGLKMAEKTNMMLDHWCSKTIFFSKYRIDYAYSKACRFPPIFYQIKPHISVTNNVIELKIPLF